MKTYFIETLILDSGISVCIRKHMCGVIRSLDSESAVRLSHAHKLFVVNQQASNQNIYKYIDTAKESSVYF